MIIAGIVILCYVALMFSFFFGFDKVSSFSFSNQKVKTSFSVIIPFRNEAENLPKLLDSIHRLNYPSKHIEFIFVDDESSDDSVQLITKSLHGYDVRFSIVKNIRTSNSPKKDAIQVAIQRAAHEWIITTDADCMLPKDWLQCYNAYIQKQDVIMIAGPVKYYIEKTFLETLQQVEFHTLQGVTIGSFGIKNPMMCNGANLAYTKTAFFAVHGFEGNNSIASGDDVFLFEKMYQLNAEKVHFLKSKAALVTTLPEKTWKGFIEQRVRWASKSSHYKNSFTKLVGLLVVLGNLTMVISFALTVFQAFPLHFFLIIFLIKTIADVLLHLKFNQFFLKRNKLPRYIINGFVYPFMSIFIVILTIFSGYTWKGRHFMK